MLCVACYGINVMTWPVPSILLKKEASVVAWRKASAGGGAAQRSAGAAVFLSASSRRAAHGRNQQMHSPAVGCRHGMENQGLFLWRGTIVLAEHHKHGRKSSK